MPLCTYVGCHYDAMTGRQYCAHHTGEQINRGAAERVETEYEDLTPQEVFDRCGDGRFAAAELGAKSVTNWLTSRNAKILIPKPKQKPKRADGLWRVENACGEPGACWVSGGKSFRMIYSDGSYSHRAPIVECLTFLDDQPIIFPDWPDKAGHQERIAADVQRDRDLPTDGWTTEQRLCRLEQRLHHLEGTVMDDREARLKAEGKK